MRKLSRRDFLKFSGLALSGLALSPYVPDKISFDDAQIVRVATSEVQVFEQPAAKSAVVGRWLRDQLIHVYKEVDGEVVDNNPVWYRVWGGYIHRDRLQKVKVIYNKPLEYITEGQRQLLEVTVPITNPWRKSKAYGWEIINPPIYFGSVHWAAAIETGPDGAPWYRIFDELDSNIAYYLPCLHLRPIPLEELSPLSPEVPKDQKRIEVNLTTQTLTAYEYDKPVFQTKISSGIPAGDFKTPDGNFHIEEKVPAKHMGYSYFGLSKEGQGIVNLFADADNYVLPGVPWTCFFTPAGHAFHGTYWHENFGAPMSHGCINMRTPEAKWLFRWAMPAHTVEGLATQTSFRGGLGTAVNIHY